MPPAQEQRRIVALSAFKFAQIALPLCSLTEQQEIVRLLEERFAAIEQQEQEINSALNQAERLRQTIGPVFS